VTGGGFLIIAIGLVLGILAVRGAKQPQRSTQPAHGQHSGGYQSWQS
jgi:hypothetical protein